MQILTGLEHCQCTKTKAIIYNRIIIFLVLLFCILRVNAQAVREQRVYLWDVSESLNSNGLWEPLQQNLIDAINNVPVNPLNRLVIIPFYSTPQKPIEAIASEEGKQYLIQEIKRRGTKAVDDKQGRYTNIAAAIQKFHQVSKTDFKNYMFLYTDGKQEDCNRKTCMSILEEELNRWNPQNHKGKREYGFYILVNSEADNEYVRQADRQYSNFWVIDNANVSIKVLSFPNVINYNVATPNTNSNNVSHGREVMLGGDYAAFMDDIGFCSNDTYYEVDASADIANGKMKIMVQKKKGAVIPEGEHDITLMVNKRSSKDAYSFLETDKVIVRCINHPEHYAEISISVNGKQATNLGATKYYSSFLWCKEKTTPIDAELNVVMNDDARKANASFVLFFQKLKEFEDNQFFIYADGTDITKSGLKICGSRKIPIKIIPSSNCNASSFGGYITFRNPNGMHRINDITIDTDTKSGCVLSCNFRHFAQMNPLKKWLYIAAFIILFFAVMRIIYVNFNHSLGMRGTINIRYPESEGYIPYRISGYKKYTFTNIVRKQGWMHRLFMGKYGFPSERTTNHFWTEPLSIKKKGKNKIVIEMNSHYLINDSPIRHPHLCTKNITDIKITNIKENTQIELTY